MASYLSQQVNDWNKIRDRFFSGRHHAQGMEWAKWGLGMGKGLPLLARGLGIGMTAWGAYEGWQQGGLWGATKATAFGLGESYLLGRGLSMLAAGGSTALGVAGATIGAGALGVGLYANMTGQSVANVLSPLARPALHDYVRRRARLEMGTGVIDPYGNAATMRQRSLQAMSNSRINGRSALGSEAFMTYKPYFR